MLASYADHRAQLKAILRAWGMPEDNAEITAEVLAWSDLHGVDSHGISMIPRYDELRRKSRVRMDARPRIVSQTPVSAVVDGGGGLGHVPAHFAMSTVIAKAKTAGMAAAVVRASAHFGAAGFYTLMAASAGLIGIACTSASSIQVAPTFGKQARLGTDPWSFAAPSSDGEPLRHSRQARDGRSRPGETDDTSASRIGEAKAEAEAPQAVGRRAVLIDQAGYVDPADRRQRLRRRGTGTHAASSPATAQIPAKFDGIAAAPKTSGSRQIETGTLVAAGVAVGQLSSG